MYNKNFSFFCWYGSLNKSITLKNFENIFIVLKNFWIPSNSWPIYYKKYKYGFNIPSINKTVYSLKYLFSFFFIKPSFFVFNVLPKKHTFTTVSRGPMVRKKQSREQVSSIYSFNTLSLCLFNFFTFFVCKTSSNSLVFFFFLKKIIYKLVSLFDFLLLQQIAIVVKLNLSVFLPLN